MAVLLARALLSEVDIRPLIFSQAPYLESIWPRGQGIQHFCIKPVNVCPQKHDARASAVERRSLHERLRTDVRSHGQKSFRRPDAKPVALWGPMCKISGIPRGQGSHIRTHSLLPL